MADTFEALSHRTDAEAFEPGEPIYRESEPGSVVFLLLEGEVVLERAGRPGERVAAGELFGESALFGEARRTDTARAVTAARVVPIGPALYASLAARDSRFAWSVRASRSRRLKLAGSALLFAGLALAASLEAQVFDVGNQLVMPYGGGEEGMGFGEVLAAGDFNGDGASDLAIGAPHSDSLGVENNGKIEVRLGGASGIGNVYVLAFQGGAAEQRQGAALAAGDFNNDGRDELVVGIPGFSWGEPPVLHAGEISVWSRNAGGSWDHSYWNQDTQGILGVAEAEDQFGAALAVGNFNGDVYEDLAIGVPNEAVGDVEQAGAVHILYGSANGLTAAGNQLWYRSGGGVTGSAETYASLGFALAAGNFDGDFFGDLAIGIPGDRVQTAGTQDGSVVVFHGGAAGLSGAAQQRVDRELLGDFAAGDFNSQFGATLAAGDLDPSWSCLDNETCADDLVVGARNAKVDGFLSAGLVYAVFGSWAGGGLALAGHLELSQAFAGDSLPETNDRFGAALAIGAFGPGTRRHFAVGTPDEARGNLVHAGFVQIGLDVDSSFDTLYNPQAQFFEQRQGLASAPQTESAEFGSALAIGDFNGDGWGDLAVGVDGFVAPNVGNTGAVQILYGALFADGFERAGLSSWSN